MKTYPSIAAIQAAVRAGETTCVATVQAYLDRIQAHQNLNAFLETFDQEALTRAAQIDAKIKAGNAGALAGAVIAIKDVLCYEGHKVSASSKILENFESLFTATCVQRLLDADAILIGRTNCDEFAMGSSNENSAFGKVLNAQDPTKVPGGSSGGSAVAVQADLCIASLGTDTGGSVRQPASFCGIVGMKPTYGRISRNGVIAYASSFDQVGVFTKSIADAALLIHVMSGADEMDSTTSEKNASPATIRATSLNQKRIAYFPSFLDTPGIDNEIKAAFNQLLESAKAAGAIVEPVVFDKLDYLIPAYYVLTTAEASSNLARYDGVHYGYRSPQAVDLESVYRKSRSEGFGAEVKRRIMLGTFVLSEGFYDAYYTQAQRVRRIVKDEMDAIFDKYDLILTPTTPTTAFGFGDKKDPIAMYLNDIYTVLCNLVGLPGISIPLANHSNGLPFGVQLITQRFQEEQLFAFSQAISNCTQTPVT